MNHGFKLGDIVQVYGSQYRYPYKIVAIQTKVTGRTEVQVIDTASGKQVTGGPYPSNIFMLVQSAYDDKEWI